MREAIARAEAAGCYSVALTSRKERSDAHRFYERLGFERSSEGFRLALWGTGRGEAKIRIGYLRYGLMCRLSKRC